MSRLYIEGSKQLGGNLPVYGSKNASLPLLAASLLTDSSVTFHNIPQIRDVENFLAIMNALGVSTKTNETTITISCRDLNIEALPTKLIGELRGSILLLGPLLARLRRPVSIPKPGGDIIGARPLTAHLDGFQQLGAVVTEDDNQVTIDSRDLQAGEVTLSEFSVTATENIMLAAAALPGTTTIHIAAAEPHVVALADLLNAMGAGVHGAGTHTISITGAEKLGPAEITNPPDMIEAGTFLLLALATGADMNVSSVPYDHLRLFWKLLDTMRVVYDVTLESNGLATVRVEPSATQALRGARFQALPYPGLPTDLQAPFSVVATQAQGQSLIHDPLYEGRFKHVNELEKMGADVVFCDPHRVIITGPTRLHGRHIPSLDIRAGVTLIIAGLVAEGETVIENVEIVERGYADLAARLRNIGADVREEKA